MCRSLPHEPGAHNALLFPGLKTVMGLGGLLPEEMLLRHSVLGAGQVKLIDVVQVSNTLGVLVFGTTDPKSVANGGSLFKWMLGLS